MRVWDKVGDWFRSGTKLQLELDAPRVPAGGLLAGSVRVQAGRRGVEVDGLRVCLLRTAVRSRDGLPAGDIVQRTVVDAIVGSGLRLSAKSGDTVKFAIRIPAGVSPSDDDTSYRLRVELTEPAGKGPRVQRAVRVVDAAAIRPDLDTIYDRWPALREVADPEATADALRQLRFQHETSDPADDLLAAEPRLSQLMHREEPAIRDAALDAWTEILEHRGNRSHLQTLRTLIDQGGLAPAQLARVAESAARVGAAASVPLLQGLSTHQEAAVRRAVALALTRLPASVGAKLAVLDAMARDADPTVRAAVFRGYADFAQDADVVTRVAAHTTMEPSAPVLEACVHALRGAFAHGHGEIARPALQRLAQHPKPLVRAAVARTLAVVESESGTRTLVDALLADPAPEVRASAVAELRNLGSSATDYLGRIEQLAAEDPAAEVRAAALATLPGLVAPAELRDYFRSLLDADPPVEVIRGMLTGIRRHRAPELDDVLDALSDHHDGGLADEARALLDGR